MYSIIVKPVSKLLINKCKGTTHKDVIHIDNVISLHWNGKLCLKYHNNAWISKLLEQILF